MDQLSKSKLGLLQPSRSVTFAFLSADGSMALLFPPPDDSSSPVAAINGTDSSSLSSLLNTHQLMAITSITQTLLSMTYMSFIPEQINRRKLLKSNLDVEELNAAMQDFNSVNNNNWPCAESNGAMPTLIQQLLIEQAAIKQLWNRVRAFHSQVLPGKSARTNLDVEILCLRWQDRCQQLRQAAQTLLLAELDRIGAEGRARLVERWQAYLPIIVDPTISLFGSTLYSNQPCTASSASIGQSDDKFHQKNFAHNVDSIQSTTTEKLPYYCSSSSSSSTTTTNNDHIKHRQEVATILLGVIGAAFSHELLNCSTDQIMLIESNKRQISVPLVTCQSLFECIVQPDSPSLPLNCSLRRSCIDLLGRGFAVWQPYLDISKLLLTLLALCAKSDRMLPAGPIYFPLSPAAEMCRTAQRALASIASCRPAAFVTALSKEVTRYTSMSQHQTVHLSSPLIRAQSEIMTIMESLAMNHYNELLDVMGAVADILVHCLSIQLLKFKNFSEFCPFLAKFSVISFSSNTRRIAFGLKSGSIIVHELRAGKAQTMQVHSRAVSACSFSDDGKHLASYSVEEGKLNVWLMAQSFLGMGQSQAKCIKQFAAPVNEISANGLDERFRIVWISPKIISLMLSTQDRIVFKNFVTKSTATMEQWIAQTLLMIVVLMAPAAALLLGCSRSRWMCFILLGVVSTVCFLCVCVWISLFCDQQHAGDQPNLRQFLRNFTFGAHRGLADEAPENTLAAFEYSAKLGSTFVEFDLEMTADNTPVLMHDDTVDRTTNGTGFIGQLDDDYVFSLNTAAKFKNGNFSVQKVPTLEEAVLLIKKLNMKMIIDVKRSDSKVTIITPLSIHNYCNKY
ncbi:WD repeat-containing protein [Trichinella pseudospiralis]